VKEAGELAEEIDRRPEVIDDDSEVVHPFDRDASMSDP
jgi:hypothetical protein